MRLCIRNSSTREGMARPPNISRNEERQRDVSPAIIRWSGYRCVYPHYSNLGSIELVDVIEKEDGCVADLFVWGNVSTVNDGNSRTRAK